MEELLSAVCSRKSGRLSPPISRGASLVGERGGVTTSLFSPTEGEETWAWRGEW